MQPPLILIVDDEPAVRQALEDALRPRYTPQYSLAQAPSGEAALALLQDLRRHNELAALVLADQHMPGVGGLACLLAARDIAPDARRVLLAAHADAEEAIAGINAVGIDHYLVKPWEPAAEKLYPVLDELLADWQAAVRLPYLQVKNIMAPLAHVARIRDDATLHQAAEIVALSGIGDLMVLDEVGHFVGVLSEGDILRNALPDFDEILGAGGSVYEGFQLFMRKGRELAHKPIAPLVIREPLTLHPDDHVARAATVLIDRQIRRMPVVQDGHLLGVVSRANICQAVVGTW